MWKAVMAYLGTLGIMLPYADILNALKTVDIAAFLKVLVTQGWQAALLSLIPAILVWIKNNKPDLVVHSNVVGMGTK
jgi:hypothetical protein